MLKTVGLACQLNALHYAIWYANVELVDLLLSNETRKNLYLSPNIASTQYRGLSPVELARKLGERSVVEAIEKHLSKAE